MLREETIKLQDELKRYLREMSVSSLDSNELRKKALQLKGLYKGGFRHGYSEFFPLIVEIDKDDNQYNLESLSNNLENVKELVENDYISGENEFKDLYEPLTKLSDHINLEIGRYNYYSVNEKKVKDYDKMIKKYRDEIDMLRDKMAVSTSELNEAKKKVSSVQTELISVLSIFAAIVFTFSGSLNLIGNAFGEINKAPIVKNVLILLISGFIFFNAVFLMMYIVGKITGRSIYARCKSENCTCENGSPKCKAVNRLRKRLPYVFWINVLILLMIIADVVVWRELAVKDIPLP